MENYIFSIKTAVVVFPIIALFITFPYILIQYHRYGSINKLRTLIIYSFILYLIAVYFLVILPLPSRESVVFKEGMVRLIPFGFINDINAESSLVISDISTYVQALKEPCFYTVFFNILMTVPLGMYLRYYFKFDFKKTIFATFLLSLFFEVTQITGLYFIYPYPYRVFDVDDLIMNTLGGMLGYGIMGLFGRVLPSRESIDKESIEVGRKVSGLRRVVMFMVDSFIIGIMIFVPSRMFIKITLFLIYYSILPKLMNNQTLAGRFLNVRIDFKMNIIVNSIRMFIIYLYFFLVPYLFIWGVITIKNMLHLSAFGNIYLLLLSINVFLGFYIINLVRILRNKNMFYDTLFKVTYESTINIAA